MNEKHPIQFSLVVTRMDRIWSECIGEKGTCTLDVLEIERRPQLRWFGPNT